MIKLFIRNKIVEILNMVYYGINILSLPILIWCGGLIVFLGLGYVTGFLTQYIHYGKFETLNLMYKGNPLPFLDQIHYGCGLLIMLVLSIMFIYGLIKILQVFETWIRHNIILAKNNVKIDTTWKRNK